MLDEAAAVDFLQDLLAAFYERSGDSALIQAKASLKFFNHPVVIAARAPLEHVIHDSIRQHVVVAQRLVGVEFHLAFAFLHARLSHLDALTRPYDSLLNYYVSLENGNVIGNGARKMFHQSEAH